MAAPAIPQNFNIMQGNGQVALTWSLVLGATAYSVQRSTDQVNYTIVASPVSPQYLDTSTTIGTQYWYQVASVNISGTSNYTTPQSVVPTMSGQMSLGQLRLLSQQRADRVNSQFVTQTEWNSYINQSYFELYDLLTTVYEEYYIAPPATFLTNGTDFRYSLPDGIATFLDINNNPFVAQPFYKLEGVDLGISSANNAWVTISKFTFADRNTFVYPNSSSTIYGVFNMKYRLMGNIIEFIPTPSANQQIRLWYTPKMKELIQDTDIVDGISGWTEYIIVDAAIKALQKEESDVSTLIAQKQALLIRIQDSAMNRDAGQPDRISDVRKSGWFGGDGGWGGSFPVGGF